MESRKQSIEERWFRENKSITPSVTVQYFDQGDMQSTTMRNLLRLESPGVGFAFVVSCHKKLQLSPPTDV